MRSSSICNSLAWVRLLILLKCSSKRYANTEIKEESESKER